MDSRDDFDCALDAQTPIVENMVVGVPPVFEGLTRQLDKIVEQPLLGPRSEFPRASFAFARKDVSGNRRPQAIAHRGYKAKFPENTMGAFKGAVDVGAEGLETDIHLSKDGVVVLSHDKNLKRCFGRDEKIIDCDYDFLGKLRTLKEPHEAMPRLIDLLEYLAQPGLEDIWVLLDIKLDNNADDVMRLIGDAIRSVPPSPDRPWQNRIVLGIWAAKYLPLCSRHVPGFPISHIGFSTVVARYFFKVPNVSFNMAQAVLMTPWGKAFIRKAQCSKRPVYAWTVNDEAKMRWDIRQGLDGVITDDPKLFLEVRKSWHEGTKDGLGIMDALDIARINFFTIIYSILFCMAFGLGESRWRRR
ncbi:PLC-like phosphodiesterase [Phaeosphaeria sp. MPI-PUGE-AT-0046c]|nr:PLC-like phosphodiesterase [Phaeosphaeria sp. MPI-PUGE-AT-0046c]